MSISSIPKKQFSAFGQSSRTDELTTEEMEWFADARWSVPGLISRDKSDRRAFDTDTGFATVDDARRVLLTKMELASSTGAPTFPAKHDQAA